MPYLRVLGMFKAVAAAVAGTFLVATACNSPEFGFSPVDGSGVGGASPSTLTSSGGVAGESTMPAYCDNGVIDGTETDEDCGGACKQCRRGEQCDVHADCENGECTNGRCQDASCDDDVKNGDESDIDCGGEDCMPCQAPRACRADSDCSSKHCEGGLCQAATCNDGIQNGRETDVDCGGTDCDGCEVGRACKGRSDCAGPERAVSESVTCDEDTGTCQLVCGAGTADCNQRAADGCEVTLGNDPEHCGACDTPCDLDNAEAQCLGGRCQITACAEGFENCNTEVSDGCEVDITEDIDHCGACNATCSRHHGSSSCEAGVCRITCDENFEDCNQDLIDGCESNLDRDVDNCQSCQQSCEASAPELTPFCDGAGDGCGATECEPGLGDCDGDGECTDDLGAITDCGRCGNECHVPHGTPGCDEGVCTVAECDTGEGREWADCDGLPKNGCERELQSDRSACGTCDNDCTLLLEADLHATDVGCARGGCVITSCDVGWADCDGDFENGCEVDTTSDPTQCGGCAGRGGVDCNAEYVNGTGACVESKCEFAGCEPEFGDCNVDAGAGRAGDGCETSIRFNDEHCGGCDIACETGPGTLSNNCGGDGATCQPRCASDFGDCNDDPADGCETDTQSSDGHCGACGAECEDLNADNSCVGGVCVPDCDTGFESCDGDPRDGCEQSTRTVQHCGGCGESCSSEGGAIPACSTGKCTVTCEGPFDDCNDEDAERDGCETNTNTNPAHCGGCNQACGTAHVDELGCVNGSCTPVCDDDWCVDDPRQGCTAPVGTARNCSACGDACAAPTPFCAEDGGFHCDALDIAVINSSTGDEAAFNNTSTVLSFDHELEGEPGDYRMVLIGVHSYFQQPFLVSYNDLPLAAPVVSSLVNADTWVGIYAVMDDELPAPGTRTVRVQFEPANSWGWGQVNVVELAGVDQNTPIHTSTPTSNQSDCNSSNPRTAALSFSDKPGSFIYAVVGANHATAGTLVSGSFTSTYSAATAALSGDQRGFMAAALSGPLSMATVASWNLTGCYRSASVAVGIQRAVSLAE